MRRARSHLDSGEQPISQEDLMASLTKIVEALGRVDTRSHHHPLGLWMVFMRPPRSAYREERR